MRKPYLFKNDYIVVRNEKGEKYKGYYQSSANINQNKLYYIPNNDAQTKVMSIAKKDYFEKYDISILGDIGGQIKCGEPLSYLPEKE